MSYYATTDLHGNFDIYLKITKMLKSNDMVFVLGDCFNKGPHAWLTATSVLTNPHFIYLMGNHEEIFLQAYKASRNITLSFSDTQKLRKLIVNNGTDVLTDCFYDEWNTQLIEHFKRLPLFADYMNNDGIHCYLSHTGAYNPFNTNPTKKQCLNGKPNYYQNKKYEDKYIVIHGHHNAGEKKIQWYNQNHYLKLNECCLFNLDTYEEIYFD